MRVSAARQLEISGFPLVPSAWHCDARFLQLRGRNSAPRCSSISGAVLVRVAGCCKKRTGWPVAGAPLLSLDETVERIDAVTVEDLAGLVEELWSPDRLSAAGIGPDEARFDEALGSMAPALVEAP